MITLKESKNIFKNPKTGKFMEPSSKLISSDIYCSRCVDLIPSKRELFIIGDGPKILYDLFFRSQMDLTLILNHPPAENEKRHVIPLNVGEFADTCFDDPEDLKRHLNGFHQNSLERESRDENPHEMNLNDFEYHLQRDAVLQFNAGSRCNRKALTTIGKCINKISRNSQVQIIFFVNHGADRIQKILELFKRNRLHYQEVIYTWNGGDFGIF